MKILSTILSALGKSVRAFFKDLRHEREIESRAKNEVELESAKEALEKSEERKDTEEDTSNLNDDDVDDWLRPPNKRGETKH